MSLRSSFNIDPETLYSQWANTHPVPAEPERGLAASPEAKASSSLAEWWPNKLELDRIVRSPVAIKRDILRTRLSDRAILAGLVIPATHFPWQGMRYTLFQQGYQMLNIPDEVPFPGQETAQTAYRGLNGLPVDICTPWIRSLPSDASKGVIFHKLNVADAKRRCRSFLMYLVSHFSFQFCIVVSNPFLSVHLPIHVPLIRMPSSSTSPRPECGRFVTDPHDV